MKTICMLTLIASIVIACDQQQPDLDYNVKVDAPFFTGKKPKILFDDGHHNIHKSTGTYNPFVRLVTSDGAKVASNDDEITREALSGFELLVISNPRQEDDKLGSAFTDKECNVIEKFVHEGGSLLLIADHYPIGNASANLAKRFGVIMQCGEVYDSIHFEGNTKYRDELVFMRKDSLLGDHPIMEGFRSGEKIGKVRTFRGQSLIAPRDAVELLELSGTSYETLPDSVWTEGGKTYTQFSDPVSADAHCQGVALNFGKGRVVVLGEAAMLTAQVYKDEKFGMNTPGNDNKQFALNVVRWLLSK